MVTNDWALLKLILLIQIKCNVPRVYINFHLILLIILIALFAFISLWICLLNQLELLPNVYLD